MYHDLMEFARNCAECAVVRGSGRLQRPPLHPISVSRPFQILGVEIMELPITKSGNRYAICFQDFLSKWPFIFAAPDQKTTRLAHLLTKEIIPVFGVPDALLSDCGTNLLSHIMRDVCELLGTTKWNTTAYHPQCDGMVERMNHTLKAMLRKHTAKFGKQWDQFLPGVPWTFRIHPTTKCWRSHHSCCSGLTFVLPQKRHCCLLVTLREPTCQIFERSLCCLTRRPVSTLSQV